MTDASARLPTALREIAEKVRAIHHYGNPPDVRLQHDVDADVEDILDSVRAALRAGIPEGAPKRDWEADYWKAEAQLLKVIHWGERTFGYKNNTEIRPGDDWADVLIREAEASLSPSQGAPPPHGSAPEVTEEELAFRLNEVGGNSEWTTWSLGPLKSTELARLVFKQAYPGLRPQGEAPPSVHTAIDALLDEMLWIARARADTRAERDAASNEIAAHRAAIHDAVRGLRGGEAPL